MDRVRASAAAGIVAVAFSLVATLGGPIAAPWFSWSTNALSDLGTSDGPERLLFTYGLIAAGVSGLGFIHAIRATASGIGHAAVVPYVAAMVGVVGVGLFPAGTPLHFPAAATAYLGFMFAPVVYGIGALRGGGRRFGVLSVFDSVVHLGSWVVWGVALTSVLPGLAVPEFVGALLFNVWALWVAQRAWRLA